MARWHSHLLMSFSSWSDWAPCFFFSSLSFLPTRFSLIAAALESVDNEATEMAPAMGEMEVEKQGKRSKVKYHINVVMQHVCYKEDG